MDRLATMRAFSAVAELRGFAAAGKKLGVSPSVVTRLVASLESHLGVRLLTRTTRAVALTDAGGRYLERARLILAAVEEAESAARSEQARPFGKLVVAAPLVFGRLEVAPLVSDFLAAHPDVAVELTLSDRMVHFADDGVDVAVRIGELDDSSLRSRLVGATRRVLVASPGYLKRHKRPKDPADLARHATILFTSLSPTPEWRFAGPDGPRAVTVRPRLATNSADAAVAHATRGEGIALVLSYQAADRLRAGELEIVLPRFEPPASPIHVVYPGGRFLPASVRAFVALAAARRWDFTAL